MIEDEQKENEAKNKNRSIRQFLRLRKGVQHCNSQMKTSLETCHEIMNH